LSVRDRTRPPRIPPFARRLRAVLRAALTQASGSARKAATLTGLSAYHVRMLAGRYGIEVDPGPGGRRMTRQELLDALSLNRGNVSRTALHLNMHRRQVQRLMALYGLPRGKPAPGLTRERLIATLNGCGGNVSRTALHLKLHRKQVQRLMIRYGLREPGQWTSART